MRHPPDASGRSVLDDAAGAAFEGATSFVEPVMQALPFGDAQGVQAHAGQTNNEKNANPAVVAAIAPALDAMLSNALAAELASPVGVSQMSRLLEALSRTALARPEAGAAILNRLFEILGRLPADDAAAPPARAQGGAHGGENRAGGQAARLRRRAGRVRGGSAGATNRFRVFFVFLFARFSFRFSFFVGAACAPLASPRAA